MEKYNNVMPNNQRTEINWRKKEIQMAIQMSKKSERIYLVKSLPFYEGL